MDFYDFFHLESLKLEHTGINIITMEEFLTNVAMKNLLFNKKTKQPLTPPNNQVDWNRQKLDPLYKYLSSVGYVPDWKPMNCLAAFPASKNVNDIQKLKDTFSKIMQNPPKQESYIGHPTPINASTYIRLGEQLASRKQLCLYNETYQQETLIHFSANDEGTRLLAPFYSFLFFQDWRHDLFYKRFIRDHVRYQDEIMCVAARIIHALHLESEMNEVSSGSYDSIHVRRGKVYFIISGILCLQVYLCI